MATTELLASESSNGDTGTPDPPARRLGPSKRLPTGRAVAGGLLVALAALGVLWALTRGDDEPTVEYLVLAHDVQAGDVVGMTDFEITELVLPDQVDASTLFRNSTSEPDPRWIAQTPIRAGTLALVDDYHQIGGGELPAPDGWTVTVHVDEARAMNGQASANLTVDVVGTFEETSRTRTEVVARSARIVQVAPTAQDEQTLAVHLQVDAYQTVLDLINAGAAGTLTLVDTTENAPPGEVVSSQFSGLAPRQQDDADTSPDGG
ncbi:MAG: hypothetical protein ACERLM_08975 [Acidimicrobiales bacterium]